MINEYPCQINIDIQASEYNVEKIDGRPKFGHWAKSKWKIEHWWHRFLKENTNKNDFKSVLICVPNLNFLSVLQRNILNKENKLICF